MSLTSILEGKTFRELRTKLKEDFPKPTFYLSGDLIAPPRTKNYGVVGTAFDYLLRFYLEHKNPEAVTKTWVAEGALSELDRLFKKQSRSYFFGGRILESNEFKNIVNSQFIEAKKDYESFLKTGKFNNQLYRSSLFLAQLDVVFRASYFDPKFGIYNPEDIMDLEALTGILNEDLFPVKEKCFFNPTFGEGSKLVIGADADLILDDLLIDIKVTKFLKLPRKYFNQLIGYYILSLIGEVSKKEEDRTIKRIGIYYARHGKLWTVPIKDLGDKQKFDDFKEWFVNYIDEMIWAGRRGEKKGSS